MKKNLLSAMAIAMALGLNAQSYIGFLSDNYSGVHGLISNPANIVDSRYKLDINLGSVSTNGENDYYGFPVFDLTKSDFDFNLDAVLSPNDNNNFVANVDVMGPSFMFNIAPKHSIAIFTRARLFGNVNEINGTLFDNFTNDFDRNQDFLVNEGDFYGTINGWGEIGLSYATVLLNNDQHFIKGGFSAKYLQGLGNAYANGVNINVDYDADGTVIAPGITTGSIDTAGDLNYGNTANLEGDLANIETLDGATGIGFDVGFVYEWRPDYAKYQTADDNAYKYQDVNKYKLKVGISVTDIGQIAYENSTQAVYDLNNVNIDEDTFVNANDFETALRSIYSFAETAGELNPRLPTAGHVFVDYALARKLYLNANADVSLVKAATLNSNSIATTVFLTPRYESKWISVYMPVGVRQYSGFAWGAGLRAGPLFVGSGSVLSNLIDDESQAVDFYAGLKVPIYQGKPKDKDGDGILNKVDDCPEVPGPQENNGCPWPDTDGDGLVDKDDKCPEEPGDKLNHGCPIIDTDLDGVRDEEDLCPETPGFPENNGCLWPDTDNDGVPDKDDECPNEAGTMANKGCPEVTEEIVDTLNEYGKTILFDPDKATFKTESYAILQEMSTVLKKYPNARFRLEGHTDSRGEVKDNLWLSEKRANAVRDYLINNGIEPSRLEAIGLGEAYPIATNMYIPGRAKNRRVEVKLIK